MRLLPKKKLQTRGRVVGGERPLLCLPLHEKTPEAMLLAARSLATFSPDMVEWRLDGFTALHEKERCLQLAAELRTIFLEEMPLLLTCRSKSEGGEGCGNLTEEALCLLFCGFIAGGNIDLVDIELNCGKSFIQHIHDTAKDYGVKTVFSYHNFTATPPQAELVATLEKMQASGADIAKLAVMPRCYGDVLALLTAGYDARTSGIDIPMILIAMGEMGRVSRLAAGLFGADILFAKAAAASAPGQLHIADMQLMMEFFYQDR